MAYVTPTTVSTGCLISAASWNQNVVNNVIQIATSPMFFDFVNDRLGIGTGSPGFLLDIDGAGGAASSVVVMRLKGGQVSNNRTVLRFNGAISNASLFSFQTDVNANGTPTFTIRDDINSINRLHISASGAILLNTSTSSGFNTTGLAVRQQGTADEAFSLKNTNTVHGMTSITDTDTLFNIAPIFSTTGGVNMQAFGNGASTTAFQIQAYVSGSLPNTPNSANEGAIHIVGNKKTGTTATTLAASTFILTLADNTNTRFMFKQDGTSYEHVGTAWTNFDDHDDTRLLNLAAAHLSRDPIREHFGAWLKENRQELQDLDLVTFDDVGGHFVNRSRMQELLVGAARQQAQQIKELKQQVERLTQALLGPPPAGAT